MSHRFCASGAVWPGSRDSCTTCTTCAPAHRWCQARYTVRIGNIEGHVTLVYACAGTSGVNRGSEASCIAFPCEGTGPASRVATGFVQPLWRWMRRALHRSASQRELQKLCMTHPGAGVNSVMFVSLDLRGHAFAFSVNCFSAKLDVFTLHQGAKLVPRPSTMAVPKDAAVVLR